MDPGVREMPPRPEQAAERVLHGARSLRIDMRLDGRQVHDIFPEEKFRNQQLMMIHLVERARLEFRLVRHPSHFFLVKIIFFRDAIATIDIVEPVKLQASVRIRHHGVIMHSDHIRVTGIEQRLDGALELPWRRVRRKERQVPGNIVLKDDNPVARERFREARERAETIDIRKDIFRRCPEDRDFCSCSAHLEHLYAPRRRRGIQRLEYDYAPSVHLVN